MDLKKLIAENEVGCFPVFGDQLRGEPYSFDFSPKNPQTIEYAVGDFDRFQAQIDQELAKAGKTWGTGAFLENRSVLLRKFPQMVDSGRFFHLGLDVMAPANTKLFAPLSGEVVMAEVDSGLGNYGGFVVLGHELGGKKFYTFYGHLNTDDFPSVGQKIVLGTQFASLGAREDSGQWFTHLHLQILTEKAFAEGWVWKGYCREEEIDGLDEYVIDPGVLPISK